MECSRQVRDLWLDKSQRNNAKGCTMIHLDFIMAYENGEIESEEQLIAGFQAMIDDGTVWILQGSYGRAASQLIEAGLCSR